MSFKRAYESLVNAEHPEDVLQLPHTPVAVVVRNRIVSDDSAIFQFSTTFTK